MKNNRGQHEAIPGIRPDGRDNGMGDLIARRRYRVPEGKRAPHATLIVTKRQGQSRR